MSPGRAKVWGLSPAELTLVVLDPVGEALLHPTRYSAARPRTLRMRPTLGRDHDRVDEVRRRNWRWLGPWEATLPRGSTEDLPDLASYRKRADRLQRDGESLLMMVELDDEICGLISLTSVQRGAMCQGVLGYWLTQSVAGQGLGALSVAMMLDLVIGELGLHRVEINVRPENGPSLGLCRKLGLREEGYKERYMNIAGEWADHVAFAIDAESMPRGGVVNGVWGRRLR